jgi:ankyrin repeat protein
MNEKDYAGRIGLHLAMDSGHGDDDLSENETEPDQLIAALLKYGSRPDIAHPNGYAVLDLAITRSQWSTVRALIDESAPSTVLTSLELRQFTTVLAPGSHLQPQTTDPNSVLPNSRRSYHPQSPLAVYHTAFFLR